MENQDLPQETPQTAGNEPQKTTQPRERGADGRYKKRSQTAAKPEGTAKKPEEIKPKNKLQEEFDAGRIKNAEDVAKHFTGINPLFILIAGGLAIICLIIFRRGKSSITPEITEVKKTEQAQEPETPLNYGYLPSINRGVF